MAIQIARGSSDPALKRIITALKPYQALNPEAEIQIYRQNRFSIRLRIVDSSLGALGRRERQDRVWEYLKKLPEEMLSDITMILLLAPEETATSFANMEFENPTMPVGL